MAHSEPQLWSLRARPRTSRARRRQLQQRRTRRNQLPAAPAVHLRRLTKRDEHTFTYSMARAGQRTGGSGRSGSGENFCSQVVDHESPSALLPTVTPVTTSRARANSSQSHVSVHILPCTCPLIRTKKKGGLARVPISLMLERSR